MPKEHRPRHGSMGFSPRKRSESQVPRFSSWPERDGAPKIQGFAGYKAGMAHALIVDYRPTSTTSGQEVQVPVTVVEVPPMKVAGVRFYRNTSEGLASIGEVRSEKVDEELRRVFPIPKQYNPSEAWGKVDLADVDEVRLIVYTQPYLLSGVPKIRPDLMEQRVGGGTISERIEYAKALLGKEVKVTDFCVSGAVVDVAAITRGRGWQGHHTRWGTKLLSHKNSKHRRNIGTLGNFTPGIVRRTVPQSGQVGYHQRTEYNKRVLKISAEPESANPDGGFLHYGRLRSWYLLLHGSIPGPSRRVIRFRDPARPQVFVKLEKEPEIAYVSTGARVGG